MSEAIFEVVITSRAPLGEVHAHIRARGGPFMLSLREALIERNVPAENIHYEVFGPDSWAPAS